MAIYLGDISFGIIPNFAMLVRARTQILKFGDAVNASTLLAASGASAVAAAMLGLARASISTAKDIQRVSMGLQSVYGTSRFTAQELSYLMDLADRTGRSFSDVSLAFTRLQAASVGTNLEGDRTRKIFEQITYAAARLGLSSEDTVGTLRAIEQIMSKGTLQAEELRGQLGDRLPGAFNIMADALGVTTAELNKMMKQGRVTSDALVPFADELAKRYGVDLKGSINTVVAAEQRLTNSLFRFARSADDAIHFTSAYVNTLNTIAGAADYVGKHFGDLIKISGTIAISLAAAFGPNIAMAIFNVAKAITATSAAMLGLNKAVKGNVFFTLLDIAVRLGLALGAAYLGAKLMDEIMGQATDTTEDLNAAIAKNTLALKEAGSQTSIFRSELAQQIRVQRDAAKTALIEAAAQVMAAQARLQEALAPRAGNSNMGDYEYNLKGIQAENQLEAAQEQAKAARDTLVKLQLQLEDIQDMQKDMGDTGAITPIVDPKQTASELAAIVKHIRDAKQTIEETREAYRTMMLPTQEMRDAAQVQSDIAHAVQQYADSLADAKVPAQIATQLTKEYEASLRQLKETELELSKMDWAKDIFVGFGTDIAQGLQDAASDWDKVRQDFVDDLTSQAKAGTAVVGADILNMVNSLGLSADQTTDILNSVKDTLSATTPLTDEQTAAVDALSTKLAEAQTGMTRFQAIWEDAWASMVEATRNAFNNIVQHYLETGMQNIFDMLLRGFTGGGGGGGFNILSLFGLGGGGGGGGGFYPGLTGPRLAGGGSMTIGSDIGVRAGRGMDDQLVAFWGHRGEELTVSKAGHGAGGGGGGTYVTNQYHIDARGGEIGVEEKIVAAIKAYDAGALARQSKNAIKGRLRRVPGLA